MIAVVTGAAGFIGSTLAARLVREGHEVRGIDSFADYYSEAHKQANLDRIPEGQFSFVREDITQADLGPLLSDADAVFHLAAQPGVTHSWGESFSTYSRHNIDATQRLLEHSVSAGVSRFVYASSSSIYGNALEYPTRESAVPSPFSPYGVSKLAGEHLCAAYAENFGLSTVVLRFFTVFGPGQRPDMAFTKFLTAALAGRSILVNGSGRQVRDFTYVDDVVDAIIRAGTREVPSRSVFNVAGGCAASVNEVLETIAQIHGNPLKIERGPEVPGDVGRTGGSIELIRTELEWVPRVNVEEGLRRQYEWLRSAT